MLANSAGLHGPLLSVLDGGWEHLEVGQLPARTTITVAGVIAREPEDMVEPTLINVYLYDPAGATLAVDTLTFDTLHLGVVEGVPVRSGFNCPLTLDLGVSGVCRVALVHDDNEVASLPFEVRGPGQ